MAIEGLSRRLGAVLVYLILGAYLCIAPVRASQLPISPACRNFQSDLAKAVHALNPTARKEIMQYSYMYVTDYKTDLFRVLRPNEPGDTFRIPTACQVRLKRLDVYITGKCRVKVTISRQQSGSSPILHIPASVSCSNSTLCKRPVDLSSVNLPRHSTSEPPAWSLIDARFANQLECRVLSRKANAEIRPIVELTLEDIDECRDPSPKCAPEASCNNTFGSYRCHHSVSNVTASSASTQPSESKKGQKDEKGIDEMLPAIAGGTGALLALIVVAAFAIYCKRRFASPVTRRDQDQAARPVPQAKVNDVCEEYEDMKPVDRYNSSPRKSGNAESSFMNSSNSQLGSYAPYSCAALASTCDDPSLHMYECIPYIDATRRLTDITSNPSYPLQLPDPKREQIMEDGYDNVRVHVF